MDVLVTPRHNNFAVLISTNYYLGESSASHKHGCQTFRKILFQSIGLVSFFLF